MIVGASIKVGITQRLDRIAGRDEVREALDCAWGGILATLGLVPIPLAGAAPDVPLYLEALGVRAIIVSGGNDVTGDAQDDLSARRNVFEQKVLEFSAHRGLPLFGVCHGLQAMNVHLGGGLVRVTGHVATEHAVAGPLPAALGVESVNSFHDWGIARATLASGLLPLCSAPDGTVEAAVHVTLPWLGVMWHPERPIPFPEHHRGLLRDWLLGHADRGKLLGIAG